MEKTKFVTLTIKKRWMDAIMRGEKLEEYREIKPFYDRIFIDKLGMAMTVRFRAGYRNDSPIIETVVKPRIGGGRTEWGAQEMMKYYVLDIIAKRWVRGGETNDERQPQGQYARGRRPEA
ncbi:MAG: ASCH domain-containing protein [Clostridia bacterium]|nr:ASCH domain-containing protein [Clostridia bacterium]